MPDLLTPDQFAEKVKTKYPQYKDVPNQELTTKMLDKYPSYRSQVNLGTQQDSVSASSGAQQKSGGMMSYLGNIAKNVGIGAAKGLGSTILGIGELGTKTLGRVVGAQDIEGTSRMVENTRQTTLKPEGTAQKAGFFAEQVGEFIVPAGAVSKGVKALEATSAISKAGKVAQAAVKMAPQVAVDAGIAAGQSGGDIEDTKRAAAFSVGGGVIGNVASKGLSKLGDFFFSKTIPTTIKEGARDIGKGVDVGKAISQTGVSLSKPSLMRKMTNRINTLGEKLDNAVGSLDNASRTFDDVADSVIKTLDDGELAKTLEATPINIEGVKQTVSDTIEKYRNIYSGRALTAAEQQQLKKEIGVGLGREWDKMLGTPIRAEAFAEKKIYNSLNQFLREKVPDYEKINRQLAPLMEAKKRMTAKAGYSGYLTDVIAASIAGQSGGSIFTNPEDFLKNAILGVLVKRGATSTAAKTIAGTTAKEVGKILEEPYFYQFFRKLITDQSDNRSPSSSPVGESSRETMNQ